MRKIGLELSAPVFLGASAGQNAYNIPDGIQRILAEQAALRGQSVESYAAELIRKGVIGDRTFAEISAPFREQVASSDIQDAELDELFEAARNEVHIEPWLTAQRSVPATFGTTMKTEASLSAVL